MRDGSHLERLAAEAAGRLTLVHSTDRDSANRIMREGFNLADIDTVSISSHLGKHFVHVVPTNYPGARQINEVALGYRYRVLPAKVVLQLPLPTPPPAMDGMERGMALWARTDLYDPYKAYEAGLMEMQDGSDDLGPLRFPAKFCNGWIDLDDGTWHGNPAFQNTQ